MALGATYYVAGTGSDSNPGTLSQPFLTFRKSVGLLQPGDTLYIRGGTWTEQIDLQGPNTTGTPGNYITISGYPGETVTIQYTDTIEHGYGPIKARGKRGWLIFDNLVLDGINGTNQSGWSIRDGNHHFILRNLEIRNFKANGLYIEADNITIQNNRIHHQVSDCGCTGERWYGIYFHHGSDGLIDGNEIHGNPGGGIQSYPGPISKLIIRNNSLHHNNTLASSQVEGLIVFQGKSTNGEIINNVQIYNNLVYMNGANQPDPGYSGGIRVSNGASNIKILNNTIYGNKGYGVNIQGGPGGLPLNTTVQNNIMFKNTLQQVVDAGIGSIIDHNLTTDPQFVNPGSYNFTLRIGSPAIDAGVRIGMVTTDMANISRPQGVEYDIGAYEMTSDTASPAKPRELAIK